MNLTDLIKSLDKIYCHCNLIDDFAVRGISCNSKGVLENFIFVAIKGARADGNRFIQEAIERGARAVVVQGSGVLPCRQAGRVQGSEKASFIAVKDTRKALAKLAAEFYGNPSSKIKVVGITGTNGKTTVSYLIEAVLKEAGFSVAVIGTVNYRFKDRVICAKNTTPPSIELQSLLSDMLKEDVNYAIMEVSSHALAQVRTEGINFHSAIFTNLTQDHLDYHKTKENYFKAKARLFKDISPTSFVVINDDDRYGARLKKLTPAKIITYGLNNNAEVTAKNIKFDCLRTQFRLVSPEGQINLKSQLIGRHNVYNILAAVSWAQKEGINVSSIKSAIEGFYSVPGRLEKIDFAGDFSIFVDYAHTEDALKNILKTLRHLCKKRIIVVFGCGGERDKTKRPKMGRLASELADYAIITNDNPRSEDPQEIIRDIKQGIRKRNFSVIVERKEAIRQALSLAKQGDIVLIAGKGHENYQVLKDEIIPFDDRKVIRECLQSMNY